MKTEETLPADERVTEATSGSLRSAPPTNNDDGSCLICRDPESPISLTTAVPCGHVFHEPCLLEVRASFLLYSCLSHISDFRYLFEIHANDVFHSGSKSSMNCQTEPAHIATEMSLVLKEQARIRATTFFGYRMGNIGKTARDQLC